MTNGWRAQRNLLKCLNHLPLLQEKERIAEQLLLHNLKTEPTIFDRNYQLLEDRQSGKISTAHVIELIAQQTALSVPQVTELLEQYVTLGHMEFHPSDICNLRCQGCTYGQDSQSHKPKQICFPFTALDKLAIFKPRSMLLSGGGEPTLYNDTVSGERMDFNDLILKIKQLLPNVRLALVTNGTRRVPQDEWSHHIDWIRVSIDAATASTYGKFRGRQEYFPQVIQTLLGYLETSIRYVGASFLYSQVNVSEYVNFAQYLFDLIREKSSEALAKFNLQFRPLRKDPKDTGRHFPAAITDTQIHTTVSRTISAAQESAAFSTFLRNQTNIEAVLGGNTHPPHEFSRCYYSQIFHIVRANGEVRPCFIRVFEPDFVLGNLLHDSLATISLNSLYLAARRKAFCDPFGCRQCHVNYLLEAGLHERISPSTSPAVFADPFF